MPFNNSVNLSRLSITFNVNGHYTGKLAVFDASNIKFSKEQMKEINETARKIVEKGNANEELYKLCVSMNVPKRGPFGENFTTVGSIHF